MNNRSLIIIKNKTQSYWYTIKPRIKVAAIKFAFLFLLFILVSNQEISFHIHIGNAGANTSNDNNKKSNQPEAIKANLLDVPKSWWNSSSDEKPEALQTQHSSNLANEATAVSAALTEEEKIEAAKFSNLGFVLNPEYANKKGIDAKIVAYKINKCNNYVNTYAPTAKEEAKLFGIPVAITLAQGLLESNAGDSRLAKNENNHFGIKCKAKCEGCRCANYTDDSKFDMFRVFDSAWYSFREHSNLLMNARYKHLAKLDKTDYKNWAHGLEAAGYATDTQYGEKLIKIIENLNLQRFDS